MFKFKGSFHIGLSTRIFYPSAGLQLRRYRTPPAFLFNLAPYTAVRRLDPVATFHSVHRSMGSQTFSTPSSLDNDSVTLLDVWNHYEQHSADHPLFRHATGDSSATASITWGEAIRAMHAAGRVILDTLAKDLVLDSCSGERPVIGILAVSG